MLDQVSSVNFYIMYNGFKSQCNKVCVIPIRPLGRACVDVSLNKTTSRLSPLFSASNGTFVLRWIITSEAEFVC